MNIKHILFEDSEVLVAIVGKNELAVYSKDRDPAKLRLGAQGGTLGAISMNDLTGGKELEKVLIMGKDHDPDSPNDSLMCGSLDIQAQHESIPDDAGMKKILLLTPHRINARTTIEGGGVTPPPPSDAVEAAWQTGPPERGGATRGGRELISTYRSYIDNNVRQLYGRAASEDQKGLVDEFFRRFNYLDDYAFNWMWKTFIGRGLVQ